MAFDVDIINPSGTRSPELNITDINEFIAYKQALEDLRIDSRLRRRAKEEDKTVEQVRKECHAIIADPPDTRDHIVDKENPVEDACVLIAGIGTKHRAKEMGITVEEVKAISWAIIKEKDPELYETKQVEQRREGETEQERRERVSKYYEKKDKELQNSIASIKQRRVDNPNTFYNFDFMTKTVVTPLRRRTWGAGRSRSKEFNFQFAKANSKNPDHIYVYLKQHKKDWRGVYVGKITPDYKFVIAYKLPDGVTPLVVEKALMNVIYGLYEWSRGWGAEKHFNQYCSEKEKYEAAKRDPRFQFPKKTDSNN